MYMDADNVILLAQYLSNSIYICLSANSQFVFYVRAEVKGHGMQNGLISQIFVHYNVYVLIAKRDQIRESFNVYLCK